MKVLVTGSNGFIGSNVVQKFKEKGDTVVGIDTFGTQKEMNAECYIMDIMKEDICTVFNNISPDIIIHCAGMADVSLSLERPMEDFNANTVMVYKLLNGLHRSGLSKCKFILLSSAAVYGQPSRLPIREDDVLSPLSPYALHKRMAEDICLYYINNYNFDIKILRIFSAYGPGLKKQIFWDMYKKINESGYLELYGTGKESRDYIYIDDLVEAILLVALSENTKQIIWNVANGKEVFIEYLADTFAKKMNVPPEKIRFTNKIRKGDPANWCADISRIKEIGYVNRVSIEEGITKYLDWIRKNTI